MASFVGGPNPISLNQLLANASVADTKHDFHKPISDIVTYLTNLKNEYNVGLPVGFNNIADEDTLMKYVFKDITKKDQSKIDLKTVSKIFIADFDTIENFETITDKVYSIEAIQIAKDAAGHYLTTAKEFTDKLNIANYSAFVIDAASISINDILTNGNDTPKKTIYYIYDSELDNDPAGKTYTPDPVFNKSTGHNIISCFPKNIESSKNTNYYYTWDDEKNDPYNNFFTKYNFQLSGLQKIQQGKTTKYLTNLRINNKTDKLDTKVIVDSGKANAIDALKSLILNFIDIFNKKPKKDTKEKEIFGLNTCYQQKRSGDWLQVLLCLLIRERKYINFATKAEITNISEIYLVTHDRIALCFALLMGVNVIFTHGHSGKAYSFKLNDPVQIEAILDAQISKIINDNFKIINDTITIYDEFYNEYNEKIYKHYVPTCNDSTSAIVNSCTQINEAINQYIGNMKDLNATFVSSIVTDSTKNIFKHAVQQCYFKLIFPNVSAMVELINDFKEELAGFKTKVRNANSIEKKQSAVDKYNAFMSNIQTFLNTVNIYINTSDGSSKFNFSSLLPTFTKSPAYKAAQVWTWDISISSRYLDRLIEYVTATNYKNDKNIFLYNLHNLDEECKQAIATTYAKLYAAIPEFKKKIDLQDKAIQSGKLTNIISGIFKSSRKTESVNLQKFSNVIQSFCVEVLLNLHVIDTNEIDKNITKFISKSIAIESLRYPIGNKITDKNYFPIIADVNIINENNKIIREPTIIISSINGVDTNSDTLTDNEDKLVIISGTEDSDTHNYGAYGNEDDANLYGGMPININRRTGGLPNIIIEPNPKNTIYPLLTMHISYYNTDRIMEHFAELGISPLQDIERQQLTYAERPDDFYGGNYMKGGEPDDIITDNSICFHPLLPLYMIFETYLTHITNDDITQSFDYDIFIKYLHFLMKCYVVYLMNYDNKESRKEGYIIGMGLKELLFTSNMDKDNYKFCYESLDMKENEYYALSSLSCTLSYMISGIITQTNEEKQQAKLFLTNKIFKNFTGLVNARELFLKPITTGYTIDGLTNMVKQKLLEIGEKIIQDRTNPIPYSGKINYYLSEKSTNSTPESVFSYSTTGSTGSSRSRGGNKTHRHNKKISRNNRVKHNKQTRRNRKTRKS
jgi:hypothetical protein